MSSSSSFLTLADCHALKAELDAAAEDADMLCAVLQRFQGAATSVKNLSESKVARHVKKQLCRHPDARVSTLAHELVEVWTRLLTVDVARRQSSNASSSSDAASGSGTGSGAGTDSGSGTGSGTGNGTGTGNDAWHDSDDLVACVLKHTHVLALLALKAVARSWNTRVRELCHAPGWHLHLLGAATADLTLQLSAGQDRWVHCAALLRTLTATHTLCCYDARWRGSKDHHQLQVPHLPALAVPAGQTGDKRQRSWFHLHHGKSADSRFLELAGVVHVAIHGSTLARLELSNSAIGADGAGAIAQALLSAPTLLRVDLGGNPLGDEGVAQLGAALCADGAAQLTTLELNEVGLTARGVRPLADYLLAPTCSLQCLGLRGNALGAAGAATLGACLATNVALDSLDISRNQIRDAGMQALGTALLDSGRNSGLQFIVCDTFAIHPNIRVNLSNKSLGLAGAELLAGVLCGNKWVQTLDLSRAYLGNGGVARIVRMLQVNTTLTTLRLDGVPLDIGVLRGDDAVEQLHLCGRGLGPLSAQLIGGLLRTNRTLRSLDLSGNAIGDDGASALLKELGAHRERALTSLNLANNGRISSRTAKGLAALVELVV